MRRRRALACAEMVFGPEHYFETESRLRQVGTIKPRASASNNPSSISHARFVRRFVRKRRAGTRTRPMSCSSCPESARDVNDHEQLRECVGAERARDVVRSTSRIGGSNELCQRRTTRYAQDFAVDV